MKNKIFFSLILAGLVGLSSLNGQVTNEGVLTIEDGATFTVDGDFNNLVAGQVRLEGAGVLAVGGNYSNLGDIEGGGISGTNYMGTVLMNGASAQTFDNGNDTIYNLTIDNSSGVTGANTIVKNTLTLTNGIWDISATDV
jgi:hypothetical protein